MKTRLGLCFVPFPGPSSSGDQVLGKYTLLQVGGEGCILSPPLSQLLSFLGVQQVRLLRCAVCLFWGADLWLLTLPADVNHPESQVLVSNWEPDRTDSSLVEDAVSGAEIAPFQLWLPPACLPASGRGWASPQPAVLCSESWLAVP